MPYKSKEALDAYAREYARTHKESNNKRSREWSRAHKDIANMRAKKHYLKRLVAKHGLTLDEFQRLWDQATHCPICDVMMTEDKMIPTRKVLHHCHRTNKVIGFICNRCNMAIGHLEDDPVLVQKAADFLKRTLQGQ